MVRIEFILEVSFMFRRFQEQSNSILLYKKGFQLSKRTLNSPEKSMKPETEIVEKMHVNCTCTGYDEEYMKNVHVQSASRTRYSTTSASFPLEFKVINKTLKQCT